MTTANEQQPRSLEELLNDIRAGRYSDQDMTELPTFGGQTPRNTSGVWSWDTGRLLVSIPEGGFQIVDRR